MENISFFNFNFDFNFKKALTVCGVGLAILTSAQQWGNTGSSALVSAGNSSFNNLIVDASGNYYISYYDTTVTKGSVQKFNGTSWSYAGGSAGITTGIATYNSLTADAQGNIYYSNQASYPNTGMEIRKLSGGSWSSLPMATTNMMNFHSIITSPSNVLFAYSTDGSGTVRRYNSSNGTWEQVGNSGFSGGATFPKIAVGTDNVLYASQITSGLFNVYKISANASSSDSWTLAGGVPVGNAYSSDSSFSDIALDGNNIPYVVYVSSTAEGRKLNVKKLSGNAWVQIGSANFSDTVVNNTAIAVTSAGAPYVIASIWDSSNSNHGRNSIYRFNTSSGNWEKFGDPFLSTAASTYNDIAIDPVNNYVVAAYSESGTKVKRLSMNMLGVNDVKNSDHFGIYPNPTDGIVYLKAERKIRTVEVSNAVGQVIAAKISGQQVDISHAPKGVYFVKATYEDGKTSVKKLIKK
ncbi:T9SS type A sorting domain-containing protein [uncultured Chryseobacterium sp.]|uniref:T9SS type A sorting domain-containing protein n=1 Tax=uncultured Chryseobacterium sp. TaxID=259322 RepID=UPI0025D03A95|nr:T9SS type A sorting domain-containing protein [uncultured Chryseobacterium sp.]